MQERRKGRAGRGRGAGPGERGGLGGAGSGRGRGPRAGGGVLGLGAGPGVDWSSAALLDATPVAVASSLASLLHGPAPPSVRSPAPGNRNHF